MSPRCLVLACALATTSAWRFPGLARPKEEDVIEHEVTPTGPRELTIETHDYEAHESTMVLRTRTREVFPPFLFSRGIRSSFVDFCVFRGDSWS